VVVDQLIFLSKREDFAGLESDISDMAGFDDFSDLDTAKI
jgi:hypothetical protein